METYHEESLGERLGLGQPTIRGRTIPGNHDTWRGSRGPFGQDVGAIGLFETTPLKALSISLPGDRRLVLHGIFTDRDVSPNSWRRLLARGRFESQLVNLRRSLTPKPSDEIRALLLHHSPCDGSNLLCGISSASLTLLARVAADCGFSVLLSGHKHTPRGCVHPWTDSGVFEARCGTTTARDEIPGNWYAALGFRESYPLPGVNSHVVWRP